MPDLVCNAVKYHHHTDLNIHSDIDLKRVLSILILTEYLIFYKYEKGKETPEMVGSSKIIQNNLKDIFSLLSIKSNEFKEVDKIVQDTIHKSENINPEPEDPLEEKDGKIYI